ncbi:insulinase family protein [Bizionia gelidisalsuginis]|uniref:Insulinase family protein n=2 Tax=Bizionia TaxID=283785 RepID=A0A8H2LFG6_9FLAO|nr:MULTISPECIES: M16 family metallopeptidase [Bizionia]TYB78164.1 insulinase family protein [Bizionia saleffrena]TYC12072.1 insulinase family protein [Bizionia gelidisalsuginis]
MRHFTTLFLFLFCFQLFAQNAQQDPLLPVNTKIKKGVLDNGLTYYIYDTDVTKNAASYYIIQNVGSVLENDNQQGLAHFLEHMAFNGTENFEGKAVLNTLQKEGAVFGQDINAFTAFDETVYNMNNIPTRPELIDTCLLVLHDWCNALALTDEEIDAERGVIKEEWRTRQSGSMRIFQQSLPVLFNNTKYAERMPIGLMDTVENFEYKTLRDFYHDWYRTDLQAIAVIGDVDVKVIEAKIKALFSEIPAIKKPKKREVITIPDNDELLYILAKDKEVTTARIEFGIRHPKVKAYNTTSDLKSFLLENMITTMFRDRIKEVSQDPKSPFVNASITYAKNSRTTNALTLSISPKANEQQEAFKAVVTEINRAVKFGFTQAEMDRTIVQIENYYTTLISRENDKSHEAIVYGIQQNYLENIEMIDIAKQFPIMENIFANLTTEDIHTKMKTLYTENNRFIIVTGVEGDNNLTKQQTLDILSSVEKDNTLTAYSDTFSGKTLISDAEIKPGSIISEIRNDAIDATTFKLSNGITVHYKFADKNKNDVKLEAISYGGLSLIKDAHLASAKYANTVVQQSGLGDYSATDLDKVLTGKTASTGIEILDLSESIYGSAITKDVETLLQMVYLRFVNPRFDENAYKVFKGQLENYVVRRSEDLNSKMQDRLIVALYGENNPKKRLINASFVADLNFDEIKNIYLERYKNASDFEFFIVGDVSKAALKPLLENYVASIPTSAVQEKWIDNTAEWKSNTIKQEVLLEMEDPKSSVKIAFKNNFKHSLKNELLAKTLVGILNLRYNATLRETEGGTYGVSLYANVSKRPKEEILIAIQFDCNPDKVETLVAIVYEELNKIANGVITQSDLDKTVTNYLKEKQQQENYNSHDMRLLLNYFREGYNMDNPKNFENIANKITAKEVTEFTKRALKNAKSYEIIFSPEN